MEKKNHIPETSTYNPVLPKKQPPQNTYTYSGHGSEQAKNSPYFKNRDRMNGGSNDGGNKTNK